MSAAWKNSRMNPWVATLTPHQARRVGKSIEELGELMGVLGRIQIQGLDEIDPSSGKTNRQRLHEETADVIAQINCNLGAFGMPTEYINERAEIKEAQMDEWEAHYSDRPADAQEGERTP